MNLFERIKNGWEAFSNRDPTRRPYGPMYSYRPDRIRFTRGNERTIITSIYNRLALDVSAQNIVHCRTEKDRYIDTITSGLNECLTIEANIDQTARAFIQDVAMSLFDEGTIAIVPVDTTSDPTLSSSYDILSMRTAKIVDWSPTSVKCQIYNEKTMLKEDVWLLKKNVAIIENPMYAIMNEPSSTMQRLIKKLNLLDDVDEQSSSGKLDLLIQLPYSVKTEQKRKMADDRRVEIERQLVDSKYGIGYIDGTEKITQLNRPVENNLMSQIEFLTSTLYTQLGLTETIMNGTADEATMLNYFERTIDPILSAIIDEMRRKFLTKTARTQGQSIKYFRDPFKLVPLSKISEIADKFTRNEIMTANDILQIIGMPRSNDPKADQLYNANINQNQNGGNENEQ